MTNPEIRSTILNAFQPGGAIEIPSRFAGRRDDIRELADALLTDGMCPVIYGEKGLGKSSLANQIERIALGDVELLEDLKLESHAIPESRRFVVFYLQCTDEIKSKDDLLQRIINLGKGYKDVESLPKISRKSVESRDKISLKFYESETKNSYEEYHPLEQFVSLSVEERLLTVADYIYEKKKQPILFIIDEIDRVVDTTGLASFIKSHSGRQIRFVLVGVAHSLSNILKDHASLDRIVIPMNVKRMAPIELRKIIELVEVGLSEVGVNMTFSDEAKGHLSVLADGFPWFVHILGQESLKLALDREQEVVSLNDVEEVVASLSQIRYARNFEDLYQKAVGDSPQRETVIRAFAKWGPKDIPTSEVYPICHRLGVANPSMYIKELQTKKCGVIISKAPFRESGVYSFTNAMFRQYIEIRTSLYMDVKENVNSAWSQRHS